MKLQLLASLFDCISVVGIGVFLLISRKRATAKISDEGKKARVERTLKYCGILAIVGGALSGIPGIVRELSPGMDAVQFARYLNESSPKQLDAITRFDKATAGPGQRIVVDETIMVKASDISAEAWQKFLPKLRENVMNSQMGRLPAKGITLEIRYSDQDGIEFRNVKFSPP